MNGYSLLIGAQIDNNVIGAEKDVDLMSEMLDSYGYKNSTLKTSEITKQKVLNGLNYFQNNLIIGDTLVFYFSGHGKSFIDYSGDEYDGRDEGIVLNKTEVLLDDEIWNELKKFKKSVNIIMIVDACLSGTIHKIMKSNTSMFEKKHNEDLYCSFILISATSDSIQYRSGDENGSTFTKYLYYLWKNNFLQNKNYLQIFNFLIKKRVIFNDSQIVNYNANQLLYKPIFKI
jgi:hypothetical protein